MFSPESKIQSKTKCWQDGLNGGKSSRHGAKPSLAISASILSDDSAAKAKKQGDGLYRWWFGRFAVLHSPFDSIFQQSGGDEVELQALDGLATHEF